MARTWFRVADGARRRVTGTRFSQPRVIGEFVVAAVLIAVGVVGAVIWERNATKALPVLVAARDLRRGEVMTSSDLRVATIVGARGVRVTPVEDHADLIGGVLAVDVAADSVVTPDLVERRTMPRPDEALVSLALRPGEAPADLATFDRVRLVVVRLDPLGSAPPDITDEQAEVWSVRPPTDLDPLMLLTLRAPSRVLERLALADRIRVGVMSP